MINKDDSPARNKSYNLCLNVCKEMIKLQKTSKEYNITNQLIKASTSVTANLEEANGAESRKDFLHKISLAYKEIRESIFWLTLVKDLCLIEISKAEELLSEAYEVFLILSKIKTTTLKNLKDST